MFLIERTVTNEQAIALLQEFARCPLSGSPVFTYLRGNRRTGKPANHYSVAKQPFEQISIESERNFENRYKQKKSPHPYGVRGCRCIDTPCEGLKD